MNKTIGILAHVDAGKTTFAEEILYHTRSIKNRGRVDHKNSFLDSHHIEKERGITIFSDQAMFKYKEDTYYLVDTPGHVDFSTDMERAMTVMDYAILVISAVEGVQAHTETIWYLLRKHGIPTFFFINKIDRPGANVKKTIEDIKESLTKDVVFIDEGFSINYMKDSLIESIAEMKDELLEVYLDKGYNRDLWLNSIKNMIKNSSMYPCFSGSALQDIGVKEFIDAFHLFTFTDYEDKGDFQGRVYKVKYDDKGVRVTYIKGLQGKLAIRDEVCYEYKGETIIEKVTDIRKYNGIKFESQKEVTSGELFGVTGITRAVPGEGLGKDIAPLSYDIVPTLSSKVICDEKLNPKDVLKYFRILESEDISLNVIWHERLQEIHIHVMGIIQLEILKNIIKERFNLNVEFGTCEILYKETISTKALGCGHFEPLRHYAEVHLKLEPGERNSGITFNSSCHVDELPLNYQNLIKTHVFEREHHGVLTGAGITDIRISLIAGRAHNKHTEGGDFREATYRAIRQGLENAESILLEPYYRFNIQVDTEYMGRVISDIQKFNGTFNPPKTFGTKTVIEGRGPVATFMNYQLELVAFTKGRGTIGFIFDGYDNCHNEAEVIEKKKYNKDRDVEYTSSSVFCAKGESFIVEGKNAKEYMHCIVSK